MVGAAVAVLAAHGIGAAAGAAFQEAREQVAGAGVPFRRLARAVCVASMTVRATLRLASTGCTATRHASEQAPVEADVVIQPVVGG